MTDRWLGLDFSGNNAQWSRGTTRSNVWLAEGESRGADLVLTALRRVQRLPGDGDPFLNLAQVLRAGSFCAAGIDAPFSIPAAHLGTGTHAELLRKVSGLSKEGRCFASARDFVHGVTGQHPPLIPAKPLRETEKRWAAQGVNVRSTLWAGARGGAAMTCACLTLLAAAEKPVWPFAEATDGMLVEAFPAAQLKRWGLPHQKYSGAEGESARAAIVDALRRRIRLGEHEPELRVSADATDAVLCVFGAIAAAEGRLADSPGAAAPLEGWIAVHA